MNIDYIADITEIFYSVDEFCKQIEPQFKKKRLAKTEKRGLSDIRSGAALKRRRPLNKLYI